MRGSLGWQIDQIWSVIDGIGISKAATRKESIYTTIDNTHRVSGMVHSYEYKDEVLRTIKELAGFAKNHFGIKDLEKINGIILEKYIENKIADGVSRDTLENYTAHLSKLNIALEKIAQKSANTFQAFSKNDLVVVRELIIDLARNDQINRAYKYPGAVISNLSKKENIVGRLQLEYGLRITEASYIKSSQLFENLLTFSGKGGYEQYKELSDDMCKLIYDHMENGLFQVDQNRYRKELKESARIEGDTYGGSHGLRYNFAQEKFITTLENNLDNKMSFEDAERNALKETSEALGHHREEITLHYLR